MGTQYGTQIGNASLDKGQITKGVFGWRYKLSPVFKMAFGEFATGTAWVTCSFGLETYTYYKTDVGIHRPLGAILDHGLSE